MRHELPWENVQSLFQAPEGCQKLSNEAWHFDPANYPLNAATAFCMEAPAAIISRIVLPEPSDRRIISREAVGFVTVLKAKCFANVVFKCSRFFSRFELCFPNLFFELEIHING